MEMKTALIVFFIALVILFLILLLICLFKSKKGGYEMKESTQEYGTKRELSVVPSDFTNLSGRRGGELETIGDTLRLIGMPNLLKELDNSLERVRRNAETEEGHKQFVKEIDKEIKRLSRKVHPDKVISRGGSEEEISKAQEKQTALNVFRALITHVSETFLGAQLYVDYKYEYFGRMRIDSLSNSEAVKRLTFKIMWNLMELSCMKNEKVIRNIHEFLKASDAALKSFIDSKVKPNEPTDKKDFEYNRGHALYICLRECIQCYEKINEKLEKKKAECEQNEELKYVMYDSMCQMYNENSARMNQLKELRELFIDALKGKTRRLEERGFLEQGCFDEYFVLPFASYINTLLTCSSAYGGKKATNLFTHLFSSSGDLNENNKQDIYYVAHYLNDGIKYRERVREIIGKKCDETMNYEEVKDYFLNWIIEKSEELAKRFSPESYIERGTRWSDAKVEDELRKNLDKLSKDLDRLGKEENALRQELGTLEQENRKTKQQVQELIQGFRDIMQGNTPPSTSLDSVLGVDSRSNQRQL